MAIIIQQPVPAPVVPLMKKQGVIIKHFTSAQSFEKQLLKFLKRNNVLHLSTGRNNVVRSTPLEYRLVGLNFCILSEEAASLPTLRQTGMSVSLLPSLTIPATISGVTKGCRSGAKQRYAASGKTRASSKLLLKR